MVYFQTSWDDGAVEDVGLSIMLRKFKIPAIFYIPSNHLVSSVYIGRLKDMGFEIGGHTKSHPNDMKELTNEEQRAEIFNNRIYLNEKEADHVKSFCYPGGRYNDVTVDILKELGFTSARTTNVMNTDIPKDPFRIHTSIHVYPNRKEYEGKPWYEVAVELWKIADEKNGYFHLWGHSWEIEKFNLWEELEEFFKFVHSKEYVRCRDEDFGDNDNTDKTS